MLKRMGYPDMQGVSTPSSVIDKARASLAGRLKAVDVLCRQFKSMMDTDDFQKNPSPLIGKPNPHLLEHLRCILHAGVCRNSI